MEIPAEEWEKRVRLAFEKEMLGLYVSDHPLLGLESALGAAVTCVIPDLWEMEDQVQASIGGIVGSTTRRYTRNGEPMVFFQLEDLQGTIEVVAFPRVVAESGPSIREDAILVVSGRLDHRGDELKFVAQEITEPSLRDDDGVRVKVPAVALSAAKVERLKEVLVNHPGSAPVFLHMTSDNGHKVVRLGDEHRVEPRTALYAELRELFGPKAVL